MGRPQILVVASSSPHGDMLPWLPTIPYDVTLVATVAAARDHLAKLPDLVMTGLPLGSYTGFHMALSARMSGIPVIALGPDDVALETKARAIGVRYLGGAAGDAQVACVVEDALHASAETPFFPSGTAVLRVAER